MSRAESREPGQAGDSGISPLLSADFRAVRRGQDDAVPAVARGAAGDDARRHLHHARRRGQAKRTAWIIISWTRRHSSERVQAGEFLEHATVYGNSYGILQVRGAGQTAAGQGCAAERGRAGRGDHPRDRRRRSPELKRALVSVFLTPPSLRVLEERLRKRAHGFGGGNSKAAGRRAAGNRPVETISITC